MRKFIVITLVFILALLYRQKSIAIPHPSPIPQFTTSPSANTQDVVLAFAKIKVENIKNLTLHLNTDLQKESRAAQQNNNCKYLVNGGFYSKENRPLGLFISDSKKSNNRISSALFDGILSVTKTNEVQISTSVDESLARIALQTGPILVRNKIATLLKIRNDEQARRIVAIKDTEGNLWFVALYNPNSQYSGPYLAELPQKLKEMETSFGIGIVDAINLDGGTASAFINDQVSLEEISSIGSFFCIR